MKKAYFVFIIKGIVRIRSQEVRDDMDFKRVNVFATMSEAKNGAIGEMNRVIDFLKKAKGIVNNWPDDIEPGEELVCDMEKRK